MVALNAIETKNLTKKFGEFTAINDVSFSVASGEIHAICGENGAGKSTLMNLIFGLLQPTEGVVLINGNEAVFSSPKDAIQAGIGMVHQHFKLVPSLRVYENVMLGEEKSNKLGKIDRKAELEAVQDTINQFGFNLDANAIVGELSVGEQQRVEIVKMLHREVDILILDEPTAVLTPNETEDLLNRLIDLRRDGKTIIIITHKLEEVKKCSDRITVIRKGEYVGTVHNEEVTSEQISRLMVGRDVGVVVSDAEKVTAQEVLLELVNITYPTGDTKILENINLSIHAGEIVGVAGIEGNGQSELVEVLTGTSGNFTGDILFKGQKITDVNPRHLRNIGFGIIPEDRYKDGLNKEMTIWQNMIAGRLNRDDVTKNYFFVKENIHHKTTTLVDEYDIRNAENIQSNVSTLSGGNAQKIIMARELSSEPEVIIMSQPTRGIDIGSIESIHSKILELKESGRAILLVSSEITEILNLSDKIYVMYEGKISGERYRKDTNKEDLGQLMVGIDQVEISEVVL